MSQVVRDFYNASSEREWGRLARPYSRVEFASTMHLVEKYFRPVCYRAAQAGIPCHPCRPQ